MNGTSFRSRGFTLLELLLSALIFSILALTVTRLVINTNRSAYQNQRIKKASSLANAALEQYSGFAQDNFRAMHLHDVTMARPGAFFGTDEDPGYDDLSLTTLTDYATHLATATVKVQIHRQGDSGVIFETARNFSDIVGQGPRAAVRVRVVPACASYAARADILSNCPGARSFKVSAPSAGGGAIERVTNDDGIAILDHVAVSTAVPVQIRAPIASDFDVPGPPNSAFVPAYFIPRDYLLNPQQLATAYDVMTTSVIATMDGMISDITITAFRRPWRLRGTLTNEYPGGPVSGLGVYLYGPAVAYKNGQYQQCHTQIKCEVMTTLDPVNHSQGLYEISNVAPLVRASGMTYTVPLYVSGSSGTYPCAENHISGFMGRQPVTVRATDFNAQGDDQTMTAVHSLSAMKIASLTIRTNPPMPNARIMTAMLPDLSPHRMLWSAPGVPNLDPDNPPCDRRLDAGGAITFHNIASSPTIYGLQILIKSIEAGTTYYAGGVWWSKDALWTNTVLTLPKKRAMTYRGRVTNSSGVGVPGAAVALSLANFTDYGVKPTPSAISGIVLCTPTIPCFPELIAGKETPPYVNDYPFGAFEQFKIAAVTSSTGAYSIDNLPEAATAMPQTGNPKSSYVQARILPPTQVVTLNGTAIDTHTGLPAKGAHWMNPFSGDFYPPTPASGIFSFDVPSSPWTAMTKTHSCNPDVPPCDLGTMAGLDDTTSLFVYATGTMGLPVAERRDIWTTTSVLAVNVAIPSVHNGLVGPSLLNMHRVQGRVVEAGTMTPLAGIAVYGYNQSTSTVTDAGGNFDFWFHVRDRNASSPGVVPLSVQDGSISGGIVYEAASVLVPLTPLADPVDPYAPLTTEIQLSRKNVSGT